MLKLLKAEWRIYILSIICLNNGLSPDRRQTIIWTNAGILLIRTLGINFSEIIVNVAIDYTVAFSWVIGNAKGTCQIADHSSFQYIDSGHPRLDL